MFKCVFRTNETSRSGTVTADFGIVAGRSGDVTERIEEAMRGCV